jgi:hypothetical protein
LGAQRLRLATGLPGVQDAAGAVGGIEPANLLEQKVDPRRDDQPIVAERAAAARPR